MTTFHNYDWPEIPVDQFERLLTRCDDYVRCSRIGVSSYRFRHNDSCFAEVVFDRDDCIEHVYVNPRLITT